MSISFSLFLILKECSATQSCPTPCDLMDSSPPGSSLHRILQAKILEWIAIPFSRGSFRLRDWTQVSCTGRWIIYCWAPTYTNLIINWNQDATYWVLAGLSPKKWVFKWIQETKPTSMAILSFLDLALPPKSCLWSLLMCVYMMAKYQMKMQIIQSKAKANSEWFVLKKLTDFAKCSDVL